jgi:hypothetical protein
VIRFIDVLSLLIGCPSANGAMLACWRLPPSPIAA